MPRRNIPFEFAFPHNYQVSLVESPSLLDPSESLHQFPAKLKEEDRAGLYLRVAPQGHESWAGFFALGFDSDQVAWGVYSAPNADWFCAIAGGYAYLVNASNPLLWEQIEQRPVVHVKIVPENKLLLFAGFTSISAWGENGRLWTSERLSWEGLTITAIQGSVLRGSGWDAPTDKEVPFEIDLATGESKGGARPAVGRKTSGQ